MCKLEASLLNLPAIDALSNICGLVSCTIKSNSNNNSTCYHVFNAWPRLLQYRPLTTETLEQFSEQILWTKKTEQSHGNDSNAWIDFYRKKDANSDKILSQTQPSIQVILERYKTRPQ